MPYHTTYNAGWKFRPQEAREHWFAMKDGDELTLDAEPSNKYDPHAVKLMSGDVHVGYVPRDLSQEIAQRLGDDCITKVVKRAGGKIEIHYKQKGT